VTHRRHKKQSSAGGALILIVFAMIVGAPGVAWKIVCCVALVLAWIVSLYAKRQPPAPNPVEPADARTIAQIMTSQRHATIARVTQPASRLAAPAAKVGAATTPPKLAPSQPFASRATANTAPSEPVLVKPSQPAVSGNLIPAAPPIVKPTWIGFDDQVALARWKLPRGGVYLGTPSTDPRDPWRFEPALIDPSLPVDASHLDYAGQSMGYWPSYRTIKPNERATHLVYIHSDRVRPNVGLGYVFLYFYGLERRLLVDAVDDPAARNEAPATLAEIERLLGTYGPLSRSFHRYAMDLFELGTALYGPPLDPKVESAQGKPSAGLLIQIAKAIREGQPIRPGLAYAWAAGLPTAPRWYEWRTIEPEVRAHFYDLYARSYGIGLQSAPITGLLNIHVHGAASNRTSMTMSLNLPDPRVVEKRLDQLSMLLNEAVRDLEGLRSARTRGTGPLAEATALPSAMRDRARPPILDDLAQFAKTASRDSAGIVSVADLRQHAGLSTAEKLGKRDAVTCAQALECVGFGVEPDVRCGGVLGKSFVLFQLDGSATPISKDYAAAVGVLNLAFAMANADGVVTQDEVTAALEHVASLFRLERCDRLRLKARMQLLQLQAPSMTKLLASARHLPVEQRQAVANLVVGIAHADGRVDPSEVKLLERIYKALDLDPSKVPSDLHRYATQSSASDSPTGGLNTAIIAAKMKETEVVQNLLGRIFAEADAHNTPSPPAPAALSACVFWSLDSAHSALVQQVLDSGSTVTRTEWESWCTPLGLMPDGAIETINDAAFDAVGSALMEDDHDRLEIQQHACDGLRQSTKEVAHA
jgi:uncharacterized tellurite resistance protein B-like protein